MPSTSQQLWKHFYSTEDDHIADVPNSFPCNEQELASPELFFDLPLPPESFWVPKSHEKYWVDHHAFTHRKSSKKLISFRGKSTHHPITNDSRSFSQRFSPSPSQKSKASFIGLPRTPKASCSVDGYGRHGKGGSARLFRSLSEPLGSTALEVPEPDSPKVSCTGRVGAQKGKANKKSGFWTSFKSILRTGVGANILAK